MPLPVIHSFAGYTVHKLSKKSNTKWQWVRLLVLIFLANLPDLDFLPGILKHHALLYHRGFSHSIGAAVFCGILVGFIAITLLNTSFVKVFLLSFSAYFSHVVLDFFSAKVPMFWPFSSKQISAPFTLFMSSGEALHRVTNMKQFFYWLKSPQTVHILFFEMAVVFSILAFVSLFNESQERQFNFKRSDAIVRFAQAIIFFSGFVMT